MKIDRLLAITIYLLNHDTVSAAALAERFEVSKRTVQRDIDSLNMAGIPITSVHGSDGGYRIMDGFKLQKQIAGMEDFLHIIIALKGLASAYDSKRIASTLEKMLSASPSLEQTVFVDLSAAHDGIHTDEYLHKLESAIRNKEPVEIEYTNSESIRSARVVEPLALTYQWYAWYLFAYCREKKAYRMFKLPRISACEPTGGAFSMEHSSVEELLKAQSTGDNRSCFHIRLLCKSEVRQQVLEYLNGKIEEELAGGDFILSMQVPYERMWFSLLLGFGDKVQVLKPEELRMMIQQRAKEILSIY